MLSSPASRLMTRVGVVGRRAGLLSSTVVSPITVPLADLVTVVPDIPCAHLSVSASRTVEAETSSSSDPRVTSTLSSALSSRTDEEILDMLAQRQISVYKLEAELGDCTRAVHIRRAHLTGKLAESSVISNPAKALKDLPCNSFNEDEFYRSILNTNCESVIGYVPVPVGVVGPLSLDGKEMYVPMATTEGALVASTNRGCRAITAAGGCTTALVADGMTRAPLLKMPSLAKAAELKLWLQDKDNYQRVEDAFASTSRFGRLQNITATTAGRNVYMRFSCRTGDAMGMNMVTKGVTAALEIMQEAFPDMEVQSLSGNFCTDKKPSAVNWIQGRGKSVCAEVRLSPDILRDVLKTDANSMVGLNTSKNLVGSAMAGSIGGFNAHASNVVTAVFLATGQDCAQNVESSTCLTLVEIDPEDPEGILMSVTMPSIEVGTVGGGTSLPAQAACLDMLGVRGSSDVEPGHNAQTLARIVAATTLAGELSLMSALCSGDLISAHLSLNRKAEPEPSKVNGHTTSTTASGIAGTVASRGLYTSAAASPGKRYFAAATECRDSAIKNGAGMKPRLSIP